MKRRGFLKIIGLSSAVVVAPTQVARAVATSPNANVIAETPNAASVAYWVGQGYPIPIGVYDPRFGYGLKRIT